MLLRIKVGAINNYTREQTLTSTVLDKSGGMITLFFPTQVSWAQKLRLKTTMILQLLFGKRLLLLSADSSFPFSYLFFPFVDSLVSYQLSEHFYRCL